MLTFQRGVAVPHARPGVYDYLAEFGNVDEWDPRASQVRRLSGGGGVGSSYACEVSFAGRRVPMVYTLTRLVPGEVIEWVGEHDRVHAHDTISLRPDGDGVTVEYVAQFDYGRVGWLLDPVLKGTLGRLCDEAQDGLHATLRDRFDARPGVGAG